jgi:hypothetical protein
MSTRDDYLFSAACAAPAQELVLDPKYGNVRLTTPIGRASYVTLAKARAAQPGQEPRFSMTLLLAPEHCGDLWKAICMVANHRWPGENRPNPQKPDEMVMMNGEMMLQYLTREQGGLHNPLRQGDAFYTKDPAKYEPYRGLFVLNMGVTAVSKKGESQQPVCLNEEGRPLDPSMIYSGCYARAQVTVFAFPQPGQSIPNRGIGVLLNAVQFAKGGDKMGSYDPMRAAQAAFGQLPKADGAASPGGAASWGSQPIGVPGAAATAPVQSGAVPQGAFAAPTGGAGFPPFAGRSA